MTTVLVLQGPNLNLVGTREPEIYGHESLDEIHAGIAARAAELGLGVEFFQSNHEGALIDRLHQRDFDVAIVNAGGLTHTSVALRDALAPLGITVMSAGSHTEPGGYTGAGNDDLHLTVRGKRVEVEVKDETNRAEGQFGIADQRSPQSVAEMLRHQGLDPVWKDWDASILAA